MVFEERAWVGRFVVLERLRLLMMGEMSSTWLMIGWRGGVALAGVRGVAVGRALGIATERAAC